MADGGEKMNKKGKLVFTVLAAAGLMVVLYIALHEFGHLIVMLSAGATIDDFSIIRAHVSAHGGEYTNISDLWLNSNLLVTCMGIYSHCISEQSGTGW